MPNDSETIRTFIGIPLADPLLEGIRHIQRDLQKVIGQDIVRWTQPRQLHLTLKFLGNIRENEVEVLTKELADSCREVPAFELSLQDLGCFPSCHRPSVLWIGIGGEVQRLADLQRRIERSTAKFGDHSEERDFRPHLTIGRLKIRSHVNRLAGDALDAVRVFGLESWKVRQIHLVQSILGPSGSAYQDLSIAGLAPI